MFSFYTCCLLSILQCKAQKNTSLKQNETHCQQIQGYVWVVPGTLLGRLDVPMHSVLILVQIEKPLEHSSGNFGEHILRNPLHLPQIERLLGLMFTWKVIAFSLCWGYSSAGGIAQTEFLYPCLTVFHARSLILVLCTMIFVHFIGKMCQKWKNILQMSRECAKSL